MIGLKIAGTSFAILGLVTVAASIWGETAPEWMKFWGGLTGILSTVGIFVGAIVWIWTA